MIRLAVLADMNAIMKVVSESVSMMQQEGNTQWDSAYPNESVLHNDLAQHSLYVYEIEKNVVGMVCFNMVQPAAYQEVFWRQQDPALTVHRLAVLPEYRKKGVGAGLLLYGDSLARQKGIFYIRTDTFSQNFRMRRLFKENGYVQTGEIHLRELPQPFYCFDKILRQHDAAF